jgi:hypothetical protein
MVHLRVALGSAGTFFAKHKLGCRLAIRAG